MNLPGTNKAGSESKVTVKRWRTRKLLSFCFHNQVVEVIVALTQYKYCASFVASQLIEWIYKERYKLLLLLKRKLQLNNSQQTAKLKLMSFLAPFKRGISYECSL